MGALLVAGLAILVMAVKWDWSTVDDSGHVLDLARRVDDLGPLGGTWARLVDLFDIDRSWALFRPAYWVYGATFYWLPLPVAHVVRLAMIVVAVVAPVAYFRRLGGNRPPWYVLGVLSAAASTGLYLGIEFLSLQEVTGVALVALGLLLKNSFGRILLWTLAAWLKAPFAWLLIAYAVVAWRNGKRGSAAWSLVLGAGTIGVSAWWSRSGTYTSAYVVDPIVMWENIPRLLNTANVYVLVIFLWWAVASRSRLRTDDHTLLFGIALAGYTLQLLPWSVSAYYSAPVTYFLGLALMSTLSAPEPMSARRLTLALSLPVTLSALLVAWPIRQALQTNTVIRGTGDCLREMDLDRAVLTGNLLYVTGPEGALRMTQNRQLQEPEFDGVIEYEAAFNADEARARGSQGVVVVGALEAPEGLEGSRSCSAGIATVYSLS